MNPIEAYRQAFEARDIDMMRAIVVDFASRPTLDLLHPTRTNIPCICRSGRMEGMANILFYSDAEGMNRWCLVQGTDFISCIITEDEVLPIARMGHVPNLINPIIRSFRAGRYDSQFERNDQYGGLTLNSNRPYHYFYDQAIHLPDLLPLLPAARRSVAITPASYLAPGRIFDCEDKHEKADEYYLLGGVIHSWDWRSTDKWAFFATAKHFETAVREGIPPRPLDKKYDLILWVGITGQKRSWLNQVQGHIDIVTELQRNFPRLLLLLDGFTAPLDRKVDVPEDQEVATAIIEGLGGAVDVLNLVGEDYSTKIAACQNAQIFIANAGGGCIVPLRFCGLPGVLHSNHTLRAFGEDEYGENVIYTGPEAVTEINRDSVSDHGLVNYEIDWRSIYNRLIVVLRNLGHQNLRMVGAEQLNDGLERDTRIALFSDLPASIGGKVNSINVLCGIARRFDKIGNKEAARTILREANLIPGYRSPADRKIFAKYAKETEACSELSHSS